MKIRVGVLRKMIREAEEGGTQYFIRAVSTEGGSSAGHPKESSAPYISYDDALDAWEQITGAVTPRTREDLPDLMGRRTFLSLEKGQAMTRDTIRSSIMKTIMLLAPTGEWTSHPDLVKDPPPTPGSTR